MHDFTQGSLAQARHPWAILCNPVGVGVARRDGQDGGDFSIFNTMTVSTQERLQRAFIQISQSRPKGDLAAADSAFREAFLAYGSETPDNVRAADLVSVKKFNRKCDFIFGGLALSKLGQSLSAILNQAEGCKIPKQVLAAYPEMKQAEWDATLRLATMALSVFESEKI